MTRGRLVTVLGVAGSSLMVAARAGHVAAAPLFFVALLVPALWASRLLRMLRAGEVTSRLRAYPRTTSPVRISFTERDVYARSTMPLRFWMAFLIEGVLFLGVSAVLLVPVIGVLLEGGPG